MGDFGDKLFGPSDLRELNVSSCCLVLFTSSDTQQKYLACVSAFFFFPTASSSSTLLTWLLVTLLVPVKLNEPFCFICSNDDLYFAFPIF